MGMVYLLIAPPGPQPLPPRPPLPRPRAAEMENQIIYKQLYGNNEHHTTMGTTKHNFIFPYMLVLSDKKILPCALKMADLPLPAAPPFLPVIFLNIGAFC